MKSYYAMAIVYKEGQEPCLWSTYDSCLSKESAQKILDKWFINDCRYKPVVTWIQEYDGDNIVELEKKYIMIIIKLFTLQMEI